MQNANLVSTSHQILSIQSKDTYQVIVRGSVIKTTTLPALLAMCAIPRRVRQTHILYPARKLLIEYVPPVQISNLRTHSTMELIELARKFAGGSAPLVSFAPTFQNISRVMMQIPHVVGVPNSIAVDLSLHALLYPMRPV